MYKFMSNIWKNINWKIYIISACIKEYTNKLLIKSLFDKWYCIITYTYTDFTHLRVYEFKLYLKFIKFIFINYFVELIKLN